MARHVVGATPAEIRQARQDMLTMLKEGGEGPEGHINAWPMNEAVIDYVEGAAQSGIVNDPAVELTAESILAPRP